MDHYQKLINSPWLDGKYATHPLQTDTSHKYCWAKHMTDYSLCEECDKNELFDISHKIIDRMHSTMDRAFLWLRNLGMISGWLDRHKLSLYWVCDLSTLESQHNIMDQFFNLLKLFYIPPKFVTNEDLISQIEIYQMCLRRQYTRVESGEAKRACRKKIIDETSKYVIKDLAVIITEYAM